MRVANRFSCLQLDVAVEEADVSPGIQTVGGLLAMTRADAANIERLTVGLDHRPLVDPVRIGSLDDHHHYRTFLDHRNLALEAAVLDVRIGGLAGKVHEWRDTPRAGLVWVIQRVGRGRVRARVELIPA